MTWILDTDDDLTLTLQRTVLGVVILAHGAQKLLGWFGGYGFTGTIGYFTDTLHLPYPVALLVVLGESFGALGLVLGLGTRLGALGVTLIMGGAILLTHLPNGFFMNWFGNQAGEGFEFHLLALALSLPLLVRGAGRYSVDRWLLTRVRAASPGSIPPHAA